MKLEASRSVYCSSRADFNFFKTFIVRFFCIRIIRSWLESFFHTDAGDNNATVVASSAAVAKKTKARGHHNRRRRRMSGEDEGDLSEGEDSMAAGDAGQITELF